MKFLLLTCLFFSRLLLLDAQNDSLLLEGPKEISERPKIVLYSTISAYSIGATSLYFAWYKDFEQRGFHFFNDWGEWEQVDKYGHAYSSYAQSYLLHKAFLWSGQSNKKALTHAALISLGFQTSIEIMDGFSSEWGFSVADFGFNLLGTGSYIMQEKYWGHQKFKLKFSYWPISYSNEPLLFENAHQITTAQARANELFGKSPIEKFLKDYNAQTVWISFDLDKIFPNWKGPGWLDLALGLGAQNMYGGFGNAWEHNNIPVYLDRSQYVRGKQFVLALDYDLSSIDTKSAFLKTILDGLNLLKWPSPAIEYSTEGQWTFHLMFVN